MATESLIVELDARTAKLDKALTETNKRLDNLDKQTGKNDKSFGKLSKSASFVSDQLEKGALAAFALASSLTAVITASAISTRETELLAKQAKLAASDFTALSFATKQYGINAEQIADISKDLSDKIGEFSKVGSGAFQDFADVVGLTKQQAMDTAKEFENLSSDKVIGRMVSMLEDAGASGNQMTFVLESMGSDLSLLTPLFVDSAKELDKLTGSYKKATDQLQLTSGEIDDLKVAATSFDLLTDSLSKAGTLISANLAPLLTEFFSGIIDVVPEATQTIVDFINSFKDPEQIKSVKNLNSLIDKQHSAISELRQETTALSGDLGKWWSDDRKITSMIAEKNLQLKEEEERLRGLISARDDLSNIDEEKAVIPGGGVSFGGRDTGGTGDEVQAIADRFKTESELLKQKLDSELEIVGENNELRLELEQEYQDNLKEIKGKAAQADMDREEELSDLFKDVSKEDEDAIKSKNEGKAKSDDIYANTALAIGDKLFEGNKALEAGMVVAKTGAAVMHQLGSGDPYTAFARGAAAAATGAIQLANTLGASKGGGSISGGSSVSAATTSTGDQQSSSSLSVDASDTSGSRQDFVIKFEGGGDDITEAIAKNMKVMQLSGSLS